MNNTAEWPAPSVAVVSDIICHGRAALTVGIAAISAMGVQCVPMPTAVLSNHTGGFSRSVRVDLTGFMGACDARWREIGLRFSAICTGYLTGTEQAEAAQAFLQAHPESLKIVDPVMGDHGRMYSYLPEDMPRRMRKAPLSRPT